MFPAKFVFPTDKSCFQINFFSKSTFKLIVSNLTITDFSEKVCNQLMWNKIENEPQQLKVLH